MPERSFRYARAERANAWKQAGWSVISGPLLMQPPAGLDGAAVGAVDVVIVEWQQPGQPVEPKEERSMLSCGRWPSLPMRSTLCPDFQGSD